MMSQRQRQRRIGRSTLKQGSALPMVPSNCAGRVRQILDERKYLFLSAFPAGSKVSFDNSRIQIEAHDVASMPCRDAAVVTRVGTEVPNDLEIRLRGDAFQELGHHSPFGILRTSRVVAVAGVGRPESWRRVPLQAVNRSLEALGQSEQSRLRHLRLSSGRLVVAVASIDRAAAAMEVQVNDEPRSQPCRPWNDGASDVERNAVDINAT